MLKKSLLLTVLLSMFTVIAQTETNKAYVIAPKFFKTYRVSVDGTEYTIKEFKALTASKSPRALEQMCLYREHGGGWFIGILMGSYAYNRYNESGTYDPAERSRITRAESEGILFYVLGAVTIINDEIENSHSLEYLHRAVDYFNEDTGRTEVKVVSNEEFNLALTYSK
ncbi:MAG: hypothetical protein A2252_03495 [Elusimicrobia bacterium RIFOXYA2_FULL_39_19]|nr:MAG: hypothetical protein A2252_03495 [Elusimicrobia bacterium RIFOXYA2_FULL_39_19]